MYEYKVVPAPTRAAKVKGLKTTAERFAHALAERINAEAAGGWQFQRTESLTCEERKGLGGLKSTVQTVMIFARDVEAVRPDAGAALAAVQDAQPVYHDDEPAYDAPDSEAYDAPHAEPQQAYAPDPQPADPQPADPQPTPVEPESPLHRAKVGRQEPLFRAAPLRRPEGGGRAEPVLRPRNLRSDDDDQ